MTRIACALLLLANVPVRAADPPLVEKYLHSGELAAGDRALERALEANPADAQARFGLGVLRFVRAVERLGQALYEHGVKSESADVPFLRIPVPKNPDPTPITYPILRRIFEQCTDDLAKAESTLAEVKDDQVTLPLRLAEVKLDLTGGGKPTDKLLDILKKLLRVERFDFLKDNPEFLVKFDRGDVAWLRAYCHLLSAMLDAYLAIDGRFVFDAFGEEHFAKPKGIPPKKPDLLTALLDGGLRVVEPARLHAFRLHLLKVCELNRETWKHVRAETDDDHEWLPNPKQTGVLRLPVTDAMIDGWLAAVGEFEAALTGEKLAVLPFITPDASGFNLKALLDDPPTKIDFAKLLDRRIDAKYLGKLTGKNKFDERVFDRVAALFGDSLSVAYAAWFN